VLKITNIIFKIIIIKFEQQFLFVNIFNDLAKCVRVCVTKACVAICKQIQFIYKRLYLLLLFATRPAAGQQ